MDMSKYSGAYFIKLDDLRNGAIRQKIDGVEECEKYGKPILIFESGEKFSVNSTNNRILLRVYGKNSTDWIGKEIELYAGEVEFQKKNATNRDGPAYLPVDQAGRAHRNGRLHPVLGDEASIRPGANK